MSRNSRVIAYTVIERGSVEELAEAVGVALSEGWQPQGGVSATATIVSYPKWSSSELSFERECEYQQAMVRYAESADYGSDG